MTVPEAYDAAQVQDVLAKVSQAKADTLPFLHVLSIYGPVLVSAASASAESPASTPASIASQACTASREPPLKTQRSARSAA